VEAGCVIDECVEMLKVFFLLDCCIAVVVVVVVDVVAVVVVVGIAVNIFFSSIFSYVETHH